MIKPKPDLYYYENPSSIQTDILQHLSEVQEKNIKINNNTTYGFLLDSFISIASNIVKGIEIKINGLYAKRAQTMEDLYKHVSDFDYISFQANPASTMIKIIIPKKLVYDSSIEYDDFYNALVIPKDTVFNIGTLEFGIYYSIFIKVNKITKNILIDYDTTYQNPLNKITNYNIPYSEFKFKEIEYISFEIPIYQFKCEYSDIENINPTVGYVKKFKLEDKFYAVRVFDVLNKYEFSYSMSDIIYDPLKPTCIIKYLSDTNELVLSIPQIYFTTKKISQQIYIKIYTTKGVLDITLDSKNPDLIKASFISDEILLEENDISLKPFIDPLSKIKSMIFSLISSKISGGKNSDNFTTVKNNLIYDLYSDRVLISNKDISNYFNRYGFRVITRLDNLTERIYYLVNYITDDNSDKLLVNNSKLVLDVEKVESDEYMDSIKNPSKHKYIVMPNTIYEYEKDRNLIYPINENTYNKIKNLSKSKLVEFFNNDTYYYYPYHLLIDVSTLYPKTISYDLIDTEISDFKFGDRHIVSTYQIYVNDFSIEHLNEGCNGYKLSFAIEKNQELKNLNETEIEFYLYIKNTEDKFVGKKLSFDYSIDSKTDVYSVTIETNYNLSNDIIYLSNVQYKPDYFEPVPVSLNTKMFLTLNVKSMYITSNPSYKEYNIFKNHPKNKEFITLFEYFHDPTVWIPIERYDFNIRLGTKLEDVIENNLVVNYSEEEYARYENNVPATYEYDIYEKDRRGKLVYTINNDQLLLNKIHSAGDVIRDSRGNITYKHKKGDVKLSNGVPVVLKPRSILCAIDLFTISYKYKLDNKFNIASVLSLLRTYYKIVKEHRTKLYGNTQCYFRPVSTVGYGVFHGNSSDSKSNVLNMKLNISVGYKLYSISSVINNQELTKTIKEGIKTIIKNHLSDSTFNLVSIGDEILKTYEEYIKFLDIKGMNDDIYLQSLTKIKEDQDITIDKQLLLENNEIIIEDSIDLEFIPVE